MADKHLKLRNIVGVLFKLTSGDDPSQNLLTDEKLAALESRVAVAEANIVSALDFDFSHDFPNTFLCEYYKAHFLDQDSLFYLSKILVLDVYRTGASLFYDNRTVALSCLLLASYLLNGRLTRLPAAQGLCPARPGGPQPRERLRDRAPPEGPGGAGRSAPAQAEAPAPCLHVLPQRVRPGLPRQAGAAQVVPHCPARGERGGTAVPQVGATGGRLGRHQGSPR